MSMLILLLSCSPTDLAQDPEDVDADEDGYAVAVDCNDADENVHPDAPEKCNDADDDCDEEVDEDLGNLYWSDLDGDGYGDPATSVETCDQPENTVSNALDCDDAVIAINPGAAEICDGIDNNCSGQTDEGLGGTFYTDADLDGHGDPALGVEGCEGGDGLSELGDDCDDTNPAVYPDAPETDCTVTTDFNCDGVATFADNDADGYTFCVDCDDDNAELSPGATEICDDVDNDCDDEIDEEGAEDPSTWYIDADGDGYGNVDVTVEACDQPKGYVSDGSDCDDDNRGQNPGVPDACNGFDDNCDGIVDPSC